MGAIKQAKNSHIDEFSDEVACTSDETVLDDNEQELSASKDDEPLESSEEFSPGTHQRDSESENYAVNEVAARETEAYFDDLSRHTSPHDDISNSNGTSNDAHPIGRTENPTAVQNTEDEQQTGVGGLPMTSVSPALDTTPNDTVVDSTSSMNSRSSDDCNSADRSPCVNNTVCTLIFV